MGNCCLMRDPSLSEPKAPANFRESNVSTQDISLRTNTVSSEDTTDSRVLQRQMAKYTLSELIDQLTNRQYVKANLIEDSWIEPPSCVAALAAAAIVEHASQELYKDEESTTILLSKGGIEQLVENLDSPQNDIRETAAVALDYLLVSRNPLRCQRLNSEKSLETLSKRLTDRKEGMRFTVTCILHSFYTQHKGEFASNLIISFQQGALLRSLLSVTLKFERLSLLNQHLQHLLDLAHNRFNSGISEGRLKAMIEAGLIATIDAVEKDIMDKNAKLKLAIGEVRFAQYILNSISRIRKELNIS